MEKTQKLEAAWWWARNARLEALRQKREEYGDPRNPLRALPGREAEFEAATELSQSMGVILKALEREITRARGEAVKHKALRLWDVARGFGRASLATLGVAAVFITVGAPDPITQASAVIGTSLSLGWALKIAWK
nr:hypothetical protein [uncultured Oscillibacter sp.]